MIFTWTIPVKSSVLHSFMTFRNFIWTVDSKYLNNSRFRLRKSVQALWGVSVINYAIQVSYLKCGGRLHGLGSDFWFRGDRSELSARGLIRRRGCTKCAYKRWKLWTVWTATKQTMSIDTESLPFHRECAGKSPTAIYVRFVFYDSTPTFQC